MNTFNTPNMNMGNNFLQKTNQPYYNYNNSNFSSNTVTNNIIWVQGIEGAKAWQLSPNSIVILLDSEIEGKMYIKSSDNIGMSSLRIFSYTEETDKMNMNNGNVTRESNLDLSQYVKKAELSNIIKEIINEQFVSTTSESTTTTDNDAKPKITLIQK